MTWLISVGVVVVAIWAAVLFTDSLLRSCQNHPYIRLMERAGIVLKFGQIRLTTTRYNRIFVWLGNKKVKFQKIWFSIGAVIAALLVVPSICILVMTIARNTFPSRDNSEQVLSAVLPGVNLPTNEIPFYSIALIFCIVFHELGHALAAVREEVKILGSGLAVIGIFPAAFVDISTEHVLSIHPWQQLKVFSAGIWHNVTLMLGAIALLMVAPHVFSLGYYHGSGVVVKQIVQDFPPGLVIGDHITGINGCHVRDLASWHKCLHKVAMQPHEGFCLTDAYLESYKWNRSGLTIYTDAIECCSPDDQRGVCFAWLNPSPERQKIKMFACLPARQILRQSVSNCFSEEECESNSYCIMPALDNTTRLVRVSRTDQEDVLYICPVPELYYAVKPSNYVPKFKFLPIAIPDVLETFMEYLISFSGALAILNAIPCYALDGQWITSALVELGLSRVIASRQKRGTICRTIVILGTVLLAITVVTGIKIIL